MIAPTQQWPFQPPEIPNSKHQIPNNTEIQKSKGKMTNQNAKISRRGSSNP
jgi:hypothetical protein